MSNGMMEAPSGLEGMIVSETKVGDVRGASGFQDSPAVSGVEPG